jgi:hypothetical protein
MSMSGQPPNNPSEMQPLELQEAILELQQYLSDSVPPLVVADSIQLLLKYPPEAVLPTIRAWTAAQYRGASGGAAPVSDYLFHALKKIHMMSEFKLVPQEPMNAYLGQLKPIVMSICPAEDREMLSQNLSRLGESTSTSAAVSPVQNIHRQMDSSTHAASSRRPTAAEPATAAGGSATASSAADGTEALRGLKRVSLLLERLEAVGGFGGGPGGSAPAVPAQAGSAGVPAGIASVPAPASQALAFAARSSHSREELEQMLSRLKSLGVDTGTDNLFRALSMSVPGWALPGVVPPAAPGGGGGATGVPTYEAGAIGAMRRIITEAEDPAEASRRFHEMVKAGVERFNEGSLSQAVQTLELAERLVSEKKVDSGSAEIARRKLGEALDPDKLKKCAEQAGDQPQLRRLLQFFTAYQAEGLLEALPGEQKRDRRRLLLLLLEIHGADARTAAYERLTHSLGPAVGEEEWYFRRNLLYLLRRIPRGADSQPLDAEIDLVLQHARLGLPMVVLKEAVAALGQLKDEKTEVGLAQLMNDIEAMLLKPENTPYDAKELRALLDRVAATLARLPSRPARRTLIAHAVKKQAPLGDTMSRLAELGTQNLADDSATVDQLIELIKTNMPFKVLGVTLRQNDQNIVHVVDALSGTNTPAVRKALEEVIAKFADKDAARAASRAIGAWDRPQTAAAPADSRSSTSGTFTTAPPPPEAATASLQGDLEVFGLPALLQSLADSSASGTLTLREPKNGPVFANLTLREGKLEEIQRGKLRGEIAFYQLFEKPTPGQFAFVKGAPPVVPGAVGKPILPLTLEAMRRYDELQEAMALVPDTAVLMATERKPTPHPGEKDGSFLQGLWARASKGGTAQDFEEAVASDSYRIRRLLVHWVEEGSLKVRA